MQVDSIPLTTTGLQVNNIISNSGNSREVLLYGGAMSVILPNYFKDISDVRPIPDNQEVFMYVDKDQSLIVELLSTTEISHLSMQESIIFHFNQLAKDNDAVNSEILELSLLSNEEIPNFDATIQKIGVIGRQTVAKFKEKGAENLVKIYLALIRLPKYTTDILISLNEPITIHPSSSSSETTSSLAIVRYPALMAFKEVLRSIKILDISLFVVE